MRLEKQLKILRIRKNWLQNINWADYKTLNVSLSNDNSNKIINNGHKLSYNTCYITLIM